MEYNVLLQTVKDKLKSLDVITVNFIRQRYHTLQSDARHVLTQLQQEGLVEKEWKFGAGGYLVIKDKQ